MDIIVLVFLSKIRIKTKHFRTRSNNRNTIFFTKIPNEPNPHINYICDSLKNENII